MSSFGSVIPVTGLNIGFLGQVSRLGGGDPFIVSKFANALNVNNIAFGDTVVVLPDSSGGTYRQFADFITNGNTASGVTATLVNGTATMTVVTGFDLLAPGMFLQGVSIPAGTFIKALLTSTGPGAGTLTMSANAAATVASAENVGIGVFGGIAVREVKTQLAYPYNTLGSSQVGTYLPGQITDALVRGSITTKVYNGTPRQNGAIYIRAILNGTFPNGIVGGLEAQADGVNNILLNNVTFKTGAVDGNGVTEVTLLDRVAA